MRDEPPNAPSRQIAVWDLPVRIFHWALVLLVILQVATAQIGGNAMEYHALGGYAILTLVLFRVVWGFVGGRHARFADFLHGPGVVWRYLRGHASRTPGHNPLGGWSVVLMLISLLTQAATGLFANDDIMMEGPLAKHVSEDASAVATLIHDVNAGVLLTLIAVHVLAVLFYLFGRKQNLIVPMFTGRKRIDTEFRPIEPGASRPDGSLLAACLLGAAAGVVYLIVTA
jgi:cytochrome b